jgi:hypothetical protein
MAIASVGVVVGGWVLPATAMADPAALPPDSPPPADVCASGCIEQNRLDAIRRFGTVRHRFDAADRRVYALLIRSQIPPSAAVSIARAATTSSQYR